MKTHAVEDNRFSYADEAGRSYSSVYADGCRHLLGYTRYNKTKHPSELNAFAKKEKIKHVTKKKTLMDGSSSLKSA